MNLFLPLGAVGIALALRFSSSSASLTISSELPSTRVLGCSFFLILKRMLEVNINLVEDFLLLWGGFITLSFEGLLIYNIVGYPSWPAFVDD